ncbi:MAG: carbamoyl phosphate synthase large subunit, partial [Nitrospirae bacterium]|nr:carbamoyl phosphate synthase large subunit [Nitrospirota bacterium]
STGEVMGIDEDFGLAYAKAQAASNNRIPTSGKIVMSVKDKDKFHTVGIAKKLSEMGFQLIATRGTAKYLADNGINVEVINKVTEGRPHIVDLIKNREVSFIINTVTGTQAQRDSLSIRRSALQFKIPYTTTISGAKAVVKAIEMLLKKELSIRSIQEYHKT